MPRPVSPGSPRRGLAPAAARAKPSEARAPRQPARTGMEALSRRVAGAPWPPAAEALSAQARAEEPPLDPAARRRAASRAAAARRASIRRPAARFQAGARGPGAAPFAGRRSARRTPERGAVRPCPGAGRGRRDSLPPQALRGRRRSPWTGPEPPRPATRKGPASPARRPWREASRGGLPAATARRTA